MYWRVICPAEAEAASSNLAGRIAERACKQALSRV
jgi:hypothetical protein